MTVTAVVLLAVCAVIALVSGPVARQLGNVVGAGDTAVTVYSIVAVLLWALVSAVFAIYVVTFSSYDKTYGSMAGVVIFLVWMWLSNIALLLGAETNAELDHARAISEGPPDDAEPFAIPRDTRKLGDAETAADDLVARQRTNSSSEAARGGRWTAT